jgi:GT2 family glycosyltransferase
VDNRPWEPDRRAAVETLASEDGRVRYVAEPRPGSSVARNRGLAETSANVVAFTDDDVIVDAGWLDWLVRPLELDPRVAVTTGLVLPASMETPEQEWFERHSGFGKGFTRMVFDLDDHRVERVLYPYWGAAFGSGNSMAFRRSALVASGGFDPALGVGSRALAGGDIDAFSTMLVRGHRLVYEPRAVCWHDHRADRASLERQIFGYSVGFSAIMTKWALRRPRLLRDLAGALLRMSVPSTHHRSRGGTELPHEIERLRTQLRMSRRQGILALQLRGYALGPLFYIRSVLWARRLRLHEAISERPR